MMSGNDWWNRNVFSCWKEETDGADCTSSGRVFQKMEAATRNERWPAVDRRYCVICSCSVNDDRRRRRPGRLHTGTSWFRYDGAIPLTTVCQHSVCHERQFKVDPFWQTQPVQYREGVRLYSVEEECAQCSRYQSVSLARSWLFLAVRAGEHNLSTQSSSSSSRASKRHRSMVVRSSYSAALSTDTVNPSRACTRVYADNMPLCTSAQLRKRYSCIHSWEATALLVHSLYANNNNHNNANNHSAVIMARSLRLARVHSVHSMNADWSCTKRSPTRRPCQPTWAVSPPVRCYHLH